MNVLSLFDKQYYQQNIRYLCGIDEAGRGALAGPVVAAALILPRDIVLEGINDSKKLTEKQRSDLEPVIKEKALAYGIGLADVEEIERTNILQATFTAMKRAVDNLTLRPDFLLVDGRDFPRFVWPASGELLRGVSVVGGDARSLSIAGASILAKVHRDRLMTDYSQQFDGYNWARNKGYGTKEHILRIRQNGATPLHRKIFLRKIVEYEKAPLS
ncbi:MAG TPA: ribonuclease HII [Caldithrix abyssi]|uniref:Ribonuclease HII n=1 Tax=Caldithrix abyssi TaxID=187145 RepID=A0A7V4WVB5_CALAY|nr:ribonuclease HII [Caldithrix abyssi]